MKALVYRRYGGPEVLELADVPPPQPRDRHLEEEHARRKVVVIVQPPGGQAIFHRSC